MRKSQQNRVWALVGIFAVLGAYYYAAHRKPEADTGLQRIETDSTIVENNVVVSRDSAGNKVYENTRRVI